MRKVNLNDHLVCLTKTGLAVKSLEVGTPSFFCDNSGNFRRYMAYEENFPMQVIKFLSYGIEVELPEKWRFLWSWKVSDYTQWKARTCCNGGDYAFHEQHNIFGRMNAGKLELLDVIRHTTSAEFPYDEDKGSFQNDGMGYAFFVDCELLESNPDVHFTLFMQISKYDEYGYPQDREYSLNQFGSDISVQDALTAQSYEIWPEENKLLECTTPAERLQILKASFSWEPPKRR